MQNFGGSRTAILTELPMGNAELGQAFGLVINDMVKQSGITNPKAEDFDVMSKKWRALAAKPDKTKEDFEKLDSSFKENINELAQSYLLFIAREVGNSSGKLTYPEYEKYMLKYRFGHYDIENKSEYLNNVKLVLKNAFTKLAAHGELSGGDDLIDKQDMAAFIYAISTKSKRDENNNFRGFEIDGIITPLNYSVDEANLFAQGDNLFSVKLRVAYKVLNNIL
ncbi:hypothetical protein J6N69_04270 [bacterium]|nr:hypothetical protein [bacterium]MBP3846188.1 hypothetical protein [bacterium]